MLENHCNSDQIACNQSLSTNGVGGVGVQAHPQKLWFVENPDQIPENAGKIRPNVGKIYEHVCKIPEILGKLPEHTASNGAQRCLILINWRPTWGESHEDLFLEVIPEMICVGGNTHTKSCPKSFRQCLGKFEQKYLAPPKICLLLHLWYQPLIFYQEWLEAILESKTQALLTWKHGSGTNTFSIWSAAYDFSRKHFHQALIPTRHKKLNTKR